MLTQRGCSFTCHDMNDVHIRQECDTVHVDLFNSISQIPNNEKSDVAKTHRFCLFLADK